MVDGGDLVGSSIFGAEEFEIQILILSTTIIRHHASSTRRSSVRSSFIP